MLLTRLIGILTAVIPALFVLGSVSAESGTLGNLERKGLELIPQAATPYGQDVVDMFWIIFWICVAVFVLVVGLLVFFSIRYRARKNRQEGEAIHGNTKLEIVWTIVPFLIILFLVIYSDRFTANQLQAPSPIAASKTADGKDVPAKDVLIVKVIGSQYQWNFEYYLQTNTNDGAVETVGNICGNPAVMVKLKKLNIKSKDELYLPINTDVRFLLTSTDVLHSFWIPEALNKKDAVPGIYTDMWFTTTNKGSFVAKCTELCGPRHSYMTAKVDIVDQTDFETWAQKHLVSAAGAKK